MDNGGFQLTAVGRKPPSDEGGGFAAGEDGGRESGALGMQFRLGAAEKASPVQGEVARRMARRRG